MNSNKVQTMAENPKKTLQKHKKHNCKISPFYTVFLKKNTLVHKKYNYLLKKQI